MTDPLEIEGTENQRVDFTKMQVSEFEKYMDEKFPGRMYNVYRQREWMIENGSGWNGLVYWLVSNIERYMKKEHPEEDWEVHQIKEKFGQLRFYTSALPDYCDQLVSTAESISECLCETCGTFAGGTTLHSKGWIYNECPTCKEDTDKKLEEIKRGQ